MTRPPPRSPLFPYTTLFRSHTSELQSHSHLVCRLLEFRRVRSEEHTSELQSHSHLVCRLLLEKKKNKIKTNHMHTTAIHSKPHTRSNSRVMPLSCGHAVVFSASCVVLLTDTGPAFPSRRVGLAPPTSSQILHSSFVGCSL